MIEREEQVVEALRRYLDDDPDAALRLTGVLAPFWEDTGRVEEGRLLTERALESTAGCTRCVISDTGFPKPSARSRAARSSSVGRRPTDYTSAVLSPLTAGHPASTDSV
jgi:hypothetical protein